MAIWAVLPARRQSHATLTLTGTWDSRLGCHSGSGHGPTGLTVTPMGKMPAESP